MKLGQKRRLGCLSITKSMATVFKKVFDDHRSMHNSMRSNLVGLCDSSARNFLSSFSSIDQKLEKLSTENVSTASAQCIPGLV